MAKKIISKVGARHQAEKKEDEATCKEGLQVEENNGIYNQEGYEVYMMEKGILNGYGGKC